MNIIFIIWSLLLFWQNGVLIQIDTQIFIVFID